jgi:hypothetical protein
MPQRCIWERTRFLRFNDLHTRSGIAHTEVALLSGTATMHIRPTAAGESFILRTPTDELTTSFPHKTYMRVSSYTDAIAITGKMAEFFMCRSPATKKCLPVRLCFSGQA